jgi:hypothetical protein
MGIIVIVMVWLKLFLENEKMCIKNWILPAWILLNFPSGQIVKWCNKQIIYFLSFVVVKFVQLLLCGPGVAITYLRPAG